jgi:tripartite-type tricarboxylate transporter receptor subunit TctC
MIQAGKVRPLATLSSARLPILADVPTFDEAGIKGVDVSLWFGMSGPAGLPAPVLRRLNTEIEKILRMPDVREAFARQGAVPMGGPPERYDAFVRAEQARWSDVVRKNNIKVD